MWITKQNEKALLCNLLDQAGLNYSVAQDMILIPFESSGSTFIEDGVEIDLIAVWEKDYITIFINLMEIDENEQSLLDPTFLSALMRANFAMNICKFGFSPYGLSLLVDFDSRNLQYEEIESGITSLLNGVEIYSSILYEWLYSLQGIIDTNFQEFDENELIDYINYLENMSLQEAEMRGGKGTGLQSLIIRSLTGFAKVTGIVGVGGLIASALGVPSEALAAVLVALANQSSAKP